MRNVLALDLGTKTLGKAFYNKVTKIALPVGVFRFTAKHYFKARADVIKEIKVRNAEVIALGLPLNSDGTESERSESVRRFKHDLALETSLPIVLIDERYTTLEAQDRLHALGYSSKTMKNKIDETSALIILETYLKKEEQND
ncbi:MAG TPA: Holliday junction resolvase RuvX [Bacilli bacterium]|nr:Holliday junction resolvase RuvX [Bacilli bacterium]